MSEIATARAAVAANRAPAASTSQRVLQRKCACGGHTVGGGECEECKKKRHSLQRSAAGTSGPARVPSVVDASSHDALPSIDAFSPSRPCVLQSVRPLAASTATN